MSIKNYNMFDQFFSKDNILEKEIIMDVNILIADDDNVFRELLEDILRKNGYHVFPACDGEEVIEKFFKYRLQLDLIILDVMMPGMNGWETLKEIRRYSEIPVMMLTALGDDINEITGLQSGADDYIAKPFNYGIFLARIQSLTRKARKRKTSVNIIGDIKIIENEHKILVYENEIFFSNKEYQLLLLFARNINLLLTREQIIDRIWGYDFDGDIRTVDTHIKTLRAKLGNTGNYIETVRGSGYRFCKK